ncbi:MAG: hypothetical protein M0Z53_02170 [Thermaerobacter sp.]|nr:hypothetical protein [Thermaerobacter sp.]
MASKPVPSPSTYRPLGGWWTNRRALLFLIAWLALYAAMSLYVSIPYVNEPSAGADIVWRNVMFLHGFLIGLVGVLALVTIDVFECCASHVKTWIVGGALVATILASVGGLFNGNPGDAFATWTQIAGFFALDEMLVVLIWGFWVDYRVERPASRTLPFWVAWAGSVSMLLAAVMGHLAGWLLEFPGSPWGWPAAYAHWAGLTVSTWTGNLITSHSHEMVVAVIGTLVAALVWQWGYQALKPSTRRLARVGLTMMGFGIVAMTVIYLVAGFTTLQPPTLFAFGPGHINGIAGDDLVTGVFVMLGGLVALSAILFEHSSDRTSRLLHWAEAWAYLMSIVTVVVAGYAIELNEQYFGAGRATASGARADAIFTFWHQDFAFFAIPAVMLVLAVAERHIPHSPALRSLGPAMMAGTTLAFLGGLLYVFVDPNLYGWGFYVAAAGFMAIAYLVIRTWWSLLTISPSPQEVATAIETTPGETAAR